jgi:hypothetical protein
MIRVDCSTQEEADNVIEAFDMLLCSVPDEANPILYEQVSVSVNGEDRGKLSELIPRVDPIGLFEERNDSNG